MYKRQRHAIAQLPVFGLEQSKVHHPRNVLRLQECLERAFDRKQITFIQGDTSNDFKLRLLDKGLKNVKLKGTKSTFASLEGLPLHMKQKGPLPCRRLLAHHVILRYRNARKQHWLEESDDLTPEEVQAENLVSHSLDECAQARTKLMLSVNKQCIGIFGKRF